VFTYILASSRITQSGSCNTDPSFLRWFCHSPDPTPPFFVSPTPFLCWEELLPTASVHVAVPPPLCPAWYHPIRAGRMPASCHRIAHASRHLLLHRCRPLSSSPPQRSASPPTSALTHPLEPPLHTVVSALHPAIIAGLARWTPGAAKPQNGFAMTSSSRC
jgi:hypothetical protein